MTRLVRILALLACSGAASGQRASPTFTAVQPDLFVAPGSLSNAWADYDRDGDPDLAVSNKSGEIRLYRNDDGRFVAVGPALGLPTSGYEIRSLSWGDYDGDGWPDLQAGPGDKAPDRLTFIYRNLKGRRFVDVAGKIGTTIPDRSARHTNWIDVDNDGDLDLYATDRSGVNRLFRNDGGVFTRLPDAAAPADPRPTVGACWFDYDRDGDLDVFTANQAGATDGLWRNDGDRFTDVAVSLGVASPGREKTEGSVGCAVGDFDNDGILDVFVPAYGRNALYRGLAGGRFVNVAKQTGVGIDNHAVGSAWGDFDNDGWLDLMVMSYTGASGKQEPANTLFRNEGGRRFANVIGDHALLNAGDHGVSWIDYDRDGALDLSITRGYGTVGGHPVFRNGLPKDHAARSLSVLILDAKGLRTVPGAEVRVYDTAGRIMATRQVQTAGGYGSQDLGPVHFGLASATAPVTVEVTFLTKAGRRTIKRTRVVPARYRGTSLAIRFPPDVPSPRTKGRR